jgi:sugar phosphate isomerase/epimerase
MVAYGFAGRELAADLAIARRIGATVIEALPDWRSLPDPMAMARVTAAEGIEVHSAHGCWGGQSIKAPRVDLGSLDEGTRQASIDDLRLCIDWLAAAGGRCLVVHPGGLSDPPDFAARRACLVESLGTLADHASATPVVVCVENMPPGVHPGSRSADLAAVVDELSRREVALALDTGHAHIAATPVEETLACGRRLATTHVHDNDGRQDTHLPPGLGSIAWDSWRESLDAIEYHGPIMLECIRYLRSYPETITDSFIERLARLTGGGLGHE